jgi:hypothetical protein
MKFLGIVLRKFEGAGSSVLLRFWFLFFAVGTARHPELATDATCAPDKPLSLAHRTSETFNKGSPVMRAT